MSVGERYEQFQREAVQNVLEDFHADPSGRFLLVIPTGGGKTFTAVKAVHALYDKGRLHAESDRTMWVVHRQELKVQAQDSFERFARSVNDPSLPGRIDHLMLSEVPGYLAANPKVRFAVVDEAHHVAAKSYKPLFERQSLGILGLTATPSRHDARPLQFTRESYSIGFPDLVSIGVLLKPTVLKVEGGTYDIVDIGHDSASLEVLNNTFRNSQIVQSLSDNREAFNKVIIYVGTKSHARDLYALLRSSALKQHYESIGLILGDERRRWLSASEREVTGESRLDFIAAQKDASRAILINVDVLTEGYDDPTVNVIVMARPTSSKLVYMQALGRAVRIDPNNPEKAAFVVEVTDNLPNIRYRIDNRWLYSDVTDSLEPAVLDVTYTTPDSRLAAIERVFEEFHVAPADRVVPAHSARDRITILLFRVYVGNDSYRHIPLVITNATRQSAAGFFNYLADRMGRFANLNVEQVLRPISQQMGQFELLGSPDYRKFVFQAMENAWAIVTGTEDERGAIEMGSPWITFVSFRRQLSEASLGEDWMQFTADMLNKEPIREVLAEGAYDDSYYLVKFPLPLRGSSGVFLPPHEFSLIERVVSELSLHVAAVDGTAQWQAATSIVSTAAVAVQPRHLHSLTTIVRESIDYFRPLGRNTGSSR